MYYRATCLRGVQRSPVKNEVFDTLRKAPAFQVHEKPTVFHCVDNLCCQHMQEWREKMKETFGNVDTLAKSGGFRVYRSIKNS